LDLESCIATQNPPSVAPVATLQVKLGQSASTTGLSVCPRVAVTCIGTLRSLLGVQREGVLPFARDVAVSIPMSDVRPGVGKPL
jgi:hypothetical protein